MPIYKAPLRFVEAHSSGEEEKYMNVDRYIRIQAWANVAVAVFTATLTIVAIQQYFLLKAGERPSIGAGFVMSSISLPHAGEKMTIQLNFSNSGKGHTVAYIKGAVVYSLQKMQAPFLPSAEERLLIWQGMQGTQILESARRITEGEIVNMKAGQGYLYVGAMIRYGRDGQEYYTAICTEARPKVTPDDPQTFVWEFVGACIDPKANDAT